MAKAANIQCFACYHYEAAKRPEKRGVMFRDFMMREIKSAVLRDR
jgi:hypothetical protein